MSRIYFHSETETAEVMGSERAWLGSITDKVGLSLLDGYAIRALGEWLTFEFFGRRPDDFRLDAELMQTAHLALRNGFDSDRVLRYRDRELSSWDINLNTVLRLGSTSLKLAARIHAQCEIHGWVDDANRTWLAQIIEDGLASGVFRESLTPRDGTSRAMGWREVITMLRTGAGPVVMSYSVCDQFPSRHATTFETLDDDEDGERWYDLTSEDQWRYGMEWLRGASGHLELKPSDFTDYRFGLNGLTWLDCLAGEARLREVLELSDEEVPA